jgi:O-antigen/teichoic acid export membrane protein
MPDTRLARLRSRVEGVAKDTAWAAIGDLAQLATALITFYVVTTQMGPGEYGLYAGLAAFIAVLATLSAPWVVMLLLQEAVRSDRPLSDVLPMSLATALAGGVAMTAVAVVVGPHLLRGASWGLIGTFAAAELIAAAAVHISTGAIHAQRGFGAAARRRMLHTGARLLGIGVLVVAGAVSLPAIAGMLLVVNTTIGAGLLVYVSRTFDVPIRLTAPRWREFRSGLSYAGVLVAFAVQEDSDKTLMVRFSTAVDAGVYTAGYRAVQFATMPLRAIVAASHNKFLEHDPLQRNQHLFRSLRFTALSVGYAVPATAALVLAAPRISTLLGADFEESSSVVQVVAVLVLLRALSVYAFNGLMGLGRNGARTLIVFASAAFNVILSVALIPSYSWRGAAGATIASEVLFGALTWVALIRYQRRHNRAIS